MNYLFLRGQVPQDRSPNEIKWTSLDDCTDMWELLFAQIVKPYDLGKILYWGGKRRMYYRQNFCVEWVSSLKKYKHSFSPDVIIARGGFDEYETILRACPKAYRVGYFANHWKHASSSDLYNLILVDSEAQAKALKAKTALFVKPAAKIFNITGHDKRWDCCFVAIHPGDKRKNVQWVYDTVPRDISVLQLGNAPKGKVPKNVVVKKTHHSHMPKAMNKCRLLIAPYTSEDSAPRCISEALACNLPVVRSDKVHAWHERYGGYVADKDHFWTEVQHVLDYTLQRPGSTVARAFYERYLSLEQAGHVLRDALGR